MKKVLAVVFAAAAAIPANAQEEGRELRTSQIELDDFRLSGPPALALLGISSASVTRPNTPRALIGSLVSATGSSGLVPNGYALETAPYWLRRHPSLQLSDYYRPSISDRLRYFTAISIATSRPSSRNDSISPDARVAIAARTLLLNGRPSPALQATADSMRAAQLTYITRYRRLETVRPVAGALENHRRRLARQEDLLSTLVTRVMVGPDRELRDSTMRVLARRDSTRAAVAGAESAAAELERLENQLDNLEERLGRMGESLSRRELEPDGLVLEVAFGTRARFEEGEWDRERIDGVAVWATPMYRFSASNLEIIGVARYLSNVEEYDGENLLDLGARAGFSIGDATLSAEWVNRSIGDDRSSSRWAALFDHPLPGGLDLVASFGSDYRRSDGKRPVIATLGINLGIGAVMIRP